MCKTPQQGCIDVHRALIKKYYTIEQNTLERNVILSLDKKKIALLNYHLTKLQKSPSNQTVKKHILIEKSKHLEIPKNTGVIREAWIGETITREMPSETTIFCFIHLTFGILF